VVSQYTPGAFDRYKESGLNLLSNSLLSDLRYLELPLMLRYKAIDRKMGVSFVGGLWTNFLVGNSVYAVDDERTWVGRQGELNDLSFSTSLGMGMEYKFSRNFSFNVEPTLKYFINTSSNSNGINTYSFGVFSGLSYKF
jgi:hypothetical protein